MVMMSWASLGLTDGLDVGLRDTEGLAEGLDVGVAVGVQKNMLVGWIRWLDPF